MDKPGFLEFEPFFCREIIQAVDDLTAGLFGWTGRSLLCHGFNDTRPFLQFWTVNAMRV